MATALRDVYTASQSEASQPSGMTLPNQHRHSTIIPERIDV
jgi:hypothetical protein